MSKLLKQYSSKEYIIDPLFIGIKKDNTIYFHHRSNGKFVKRVVITKKV